MYVCMYVCMYMFINIFPYFFTYVCYLDIYLFAYVCICVLVKGACRLPTTPIGLHKKSEKTFMRWISRESSSDLVRCKISKKTGRQTKK